METPRQGMPGPTFSCINAKQFQALLKGEIIFFSASGGWKGGGVVFGMRETFCINVKSDKS